MTSDIRPQPPPRYVNQQQNQQQNQPAQIQYVPVQFVQGVNGVVQYPVQQAGKIHTIQNSVVVDTKPAHPGKRRSKLKRDYPNGVACPFFGLFLLGFTCNALAVMLILCGLGLLGLLFIFVALLVHITPFEYIKDWNDMESLGMTMVVLNGIGLIVDGLLILFMLSGLIFLALTAPIWIFLIILCIIITSICVCCPPD